MKSNLLIKINFIIIEMCAIATNFRNLYAQRLNHITDSSIVPFTGMTNGNRTLFAPRWFISPSFASFAYKESYRYVSA
ncbi:hypothetical protein PUN28_012423 [Cardiocondyla obscurior]|uniref:Uncharacterized protein n=1 Tax=Cardiocondyla obscurior TaxID=286306 RepID=A0AAW2FE80_9HYME